MVMYRFFTLFFIIPVVLGANLGQFYNHITLEDITVNSSFEFTVGPNPFVDFIQLKLEGEQPESCIIALYNSSGVLVYHNIVYKVSNPIVISNIGDLPKGTYFLKIQFEGNALKSFRMIKN